MRKYGSFSSINLRGTIEVVMRVAKPKTILKLLAVTLINGCASVSPPEGGEKDVTPPRLLRSVPANKSLLVKGRTVLLEFSEPVTVNQLSEQLQVTPDTNLGEPTITEQGNVLSLKFRQDFAANTTYSITFGEAVVDVTERNRAKDVDVVFSTGSYLDSGAVKGEVNHLLTGASVKDAVVGLYGMGQRIEADSSNPHVTLPVYSTRSLANGSYKMQHVKEGTYRIFAFTDANKNKRYDEPELIAYQPKIVTVGNGDSTVALLLGTIDTRPPAVISRQETEGSLNLRYNEGLRSATLVNSANAQVGRMAYRVDGPDARQLTIFSEAREKSQRIVVTVQDSAGNQRIDSISTRFSTTDSKVKRTRTAVPLIEENQHATVPQWRLLFPGELQLNKTTLGSITELPDTTILANARPKLMKQPILTSLVAGKNATLDSTKTVLLILAPVPPPSPTSKIALVFDSTALSLANLPGKFVSSQSFSLPVIGPANGTNAGTVTVKPKGSSLSFALELIRTDNTVVKRYEHWHKTGRVATPIPETITWNQVVPGSYRVRVLVDEDGNGKWDGPDPTFVRLPEPVRFNAGVLQVRANWEQEVTVTF